MKSPALIPYLESLSLRDFYQLNANADRSYKKLAQKRKQQQRKAGKR